MKIKPESVIIFGFWCVNESAVAINSTKCVRIVCTLFKIENKQTVDHDFIWPL